MERLTKVMTCPDGTKIYDISNKLFKADASRAAKTRMILERLAAYEDAEERGLLLRLPCEVGTAVFEIVELLECKYDYECPFDDLYDVNKCEDPDRTCENEYTSHVVIEKKFDISMLDKIGITVFLEKEDAENKLKEIEENHGNRRCSHDER